MRIEKKEKMMVEYYARRTGRYALPANVRSQLLYMVRDYDRMKKEADAILEETTVKDGMPRGGELPDEVSRKAQRREYLVEKTTAIDKAFDIVPEEYRQALRDNIMYRRSYPDYANRTTFWRHRAKFFYNLAKLLHMI